MPRLTLGGHPIHPMLIVFPIGLLPFSLLLDVKYNQTGRGRYADLADMALMGGFVGAAAAASAGVSDYAEIPSGTHPKQIANMHGLLNAGLVGLTAANLLVRASQGHRRDDLPMNLSLLGNLGLVVSAWYGGHLVYEHGVRVKNTDMELANTPEIKLPGDEEIARSLEDLAKNVPDRGAMQILEEMTESASQPRPPVGAPRAQPPSAAEQAAGTEGPTPPPRPDWTQADESPPEWGEPAVP